MATGNVGLRRLTPFPYLATLALTVSCHAGMLLWLLPAHGSERLGLPSKATGGIAAVYLLLAFGLRAPLARLVDRVGSRALVIYALAGCALSFAAIANAPSGGLLLIAVAVHAACAAALWPGIVAGLATTVGRHNRPHILGRVLVVEIVAAAVGALAANLLAYGGVNLVVTGLMVIWIGTVFAALAGLPNDAALPAIAPALVGSDRMRAVWAGLQSRTWPLASASVGGCALGMLAVGAFPLSVRALELRPGQAALATALAGVVGTLMGLALMRQTDPGRSRSGISATFSLALILAGIALGLVPDHAGPAGVLAALLVAFAGAPGCVVAFGSSVVDAVRQAGDEHASVAHLAFTIAGAVGMATGALGAGLLWGAERPAVAVNVAAGVFWLAAILHAIRAYAALREPPAGASGDRSAGPEP